MGLLIEPEKGRLPFVLRLADGRDLVGRLSNDCGIDLATFKDQPVLIEGTAYFNSQGEVVVVETERIRPAIEADSFFRFMPKPAQLPDNIAEIGRQNALALRDIIGKWPGDETDEEIEAALREIS
jgi:hypothetical protein